MITRASNHQFGCDCGRATMFLLLYMNRPITKRVFVLANNSVIKTHALNLHKTADRLYIIYAESRAPSAFGAEILAHLSFAHFRILIYSLALFEYTNVKSRRFSSRGKDWGRRPFLFFPRSEQKTTPNDKSSGAFCQQKGIIYSWWPSLNEALSGRLNLLKLMINRGERSSNILWSHPRGEIWRWMIAREHTLIKSLKNLLGVL